MPPARSDRQLLVFATVLALLAGGFVTVALLISTGRNAQPGEYEPYAYGPEAQLKENLREEGPFFVADVFGGDRSILFALEDDDVVAIAVSQTDLPDCSVKWRATLDRFECGGRRFTSDQLERFEVTVPRAGDHEGDVVIDLRHRLPAPNPSS